MLWNANIEVVQALCITSFPGSSALEREIESMHAHVYFAFSGEPGNEATLRIHIHVPEQGFASSMQIRT